MPWVSDGAGWRWYEPEFSLGWEIVSWAETNFKVPGGKFYGQPLKLGGWQVRFLVDWYALERSGAWMFRRGLVRMAKKIGKSPVGGVVLAADFCGPSKFDGWDAAGNPVGCRHAAPWLQVAAVSEDQTMNTYSPFSVMMRESPLVDEIGIDVGATTTILRGERESKVEIVTSAAGSREGQPITGAIGDELQGWHPSNGGKRLYRVLRRNTSPMGGRVLGLANAPEPGKRSVAEDIEAAMKSEPTTLVYGPQYQVKGTNLEDKEQVARNLRVVYRDAPWVDVDAITFDVMTADQDAAEVQRFYFNVPTAGDGKLCAAPKASIVPLEHGAPVAIGFDGSRTKDATAVVAIHMVTGVAYLLGYWQRPEGTPARDPWEVPRVKVGEVMEQAFARYTVARAKCDPSHWQDELSSWQNRWGRDVVDRMPVWMDSTVDRAVEATQTALQHGQLQLGPDRSGVLLAHVQLCDVVQTVKGSRTLRTLAKPETGERIDAAAALVYAQQARLEALAKGWTEPTAVEPSEPFALFG